MRSFGVTIAASGLVMAASFGLTAPAMASSPAISHEQCKHAGGKVTKGEPDSTLGLIPSAGDCKGGRYDGEPVTD